MDLLSFGLLVLPSFKVVVILSFCHASIQRKVFLCNFLSEHGRLQVSVTELIISKA